MPLCFACGRRLNPPPSFPPLSFASVISSPLGGWQGRNWDPSIGSTKFYEFCDALGASNLVGMVSKEKRDWEVLENYAGWIKDVSNSSSATRS